MSWKSYLLGDILKRKKSIEKILPEKEYKLVTIKLYHKGVCLRRVAKGSEIGSTMSSIKEGDFVLSGIDARNGAFGIVPKELDGAIVTNDFWCLELDEEILGREFFLYLTSTDFFDHICKQSSDGTTQRIRLQKDKFLNFRISIPSISEQSEILERLKNCGSKNSSISSELNHQLDLVKQLRQSFLREAMQGKLVKQDSKDGNASDLLKEIKIEKAKLGKKEKPLSPIKNDEIPFEIPENWVWCRLGEICNLITSGSRDWAKYYSKSGAIFVRMGNLSKDNFSLRMDKIQRVAPSSNSEGSRTKLEENDILISITGEVGNLGLIPKNFGEAYINQHTALVRLNKILPTIFFCYCFLTDFLKIQFNAPKRGMKNSFRLTDIQYLTIPLPPLSEQHRIVKKLEELMKYCDELEKNIQQSKSENEKLLQQVLREALSGEIK
ncbi:MAG: restriction endonuclease subunit S [bacterium]|jgi:type I restriction enzyme S subunit|nr:restriction endonuclease subunit S [bacterium]